MLSVPAAEEKPLETQLLEEAEAHEVPSRVREGPEGILTQVGLLQGQVLVLTLQAGLRAPSAAPASQSPCSSVSGSIPDLTLQSMPSLHHVASLMGTTYYYYKDG